MNNNIINFGKKHRGKSFEWLIFTYPKYAEWIWDNRVYENERCFTPDASALFVELMKRASHLGGKCDRCGCNVTQRVLRWSRHSGHFMDASFICGYEECDWALQDDQEYSEPSMFAPPDFSIIDARKVVKQVKLKYIGRQKINEHEMVKFFHNDSNFSEFTPGFFDFNNPILNLNEIANRIML